MDWIAPQSNEATPFDSLAATPQQSPGFLSRVGQGAVTLRSNLLQGVGEGALQTVQGTAKLINKIPVVGEILAPTQGIQAMQPLVTPDNTTQQIGKSAEDIAEFVAGDEALKAASLGDRLLKIQKVADAYETASPFVRRTIEAGMNALQNFRSLSAPLYIQPVSFNSYPIGNYADHSI